MCLMFILLVFSTDLNEILPEKTPKADGKPAAFLLSMKTHTHTHIRLLNYQNEWGHCVYYF